jgi:transposase
MLLSEGQMSELQGCGPDDRRLSQGQGVARRKGYDADWFRQALAERGVTPCIPSKASREIQIDYDKTLYRQRHKIENMFGRIKDWRRVHTRYGRSPHTSMSAICIAVTVIFWL